MFSAKRLIRKIKEFRKRNKLTQMTFAKQIGTSSSTLSKWESEKTNFNPDLKQIVGIAKAMGITPSELLSQGKNTINASVEDSDKKASKTVKKPQPKKKPSNRTVKPSKMAAASKETKVKKAISTKEAVNKVRETSVKTAKASIAKTAATPIKNETSKRKPGRPKKQPKA